MQCFIFLSDDSRKDSATTTAHSKRLIGLLKEQKVLTSALSKILENADGCVEQYRCASSLYLMSVLYQFYSIIMYWGISSPGHGKEVVDVLNNIYKRYIYQLISNVRLPVSKILICRF